MNVGHTRSVDYLHRGDHITCLGGHHSVEAKVPSAPAAACLQATDRHADQAPRTQRWLATWARPGALSLALIPAALGGHSGPLAQPSALAFRSTGPGQR
jgi:hypothetical protein